MIILEDIYKKNLENESQIWWNFIKNKLLNGNYKFNKKKQKNKSFLYKYGFTDIDQAIRYCINKDIDVYRCYTTYDYGKKSEEEMMMYLDAIPNEIRKTMNDRLVFACELDSDNLLYIQIENYHNDKINLESFHDIKKNMIPLKNRTEYLVEFKNMKNKELKESKLNENLSLQQIRSKDVYSGNDHVNKFFNIRKSLIGNPNKNVKFITSELNSDGSADFLFQTVTTPYDEENHVYKELEDGPISDTMNSSELVNNIANEYMMCIRVNDFWDLIEELEIVEQNEFDKNTLASILDLSEDVKYSCNCPSFVFTGVSFFATLENASLIPNNIYPKKWDKYRMNALCCKHLSGLFRNLSFFENQMSMSIKKNMIDQGLLY